MKSTKEALDCTLQCVSGTELPYEVVICFTDEERRVTQLVSFTTEIQTGVHLILEYALCPFYHVFLVGKEVMYDFLYISQDKNNHPSWWLLTGNC